MGRRRNTTVNRITTWRYVRTTHSQSPEYSGCFPMIIILPRHLFLKFSATEVRSRCSPLSRMADKVVAVSGEITQDSVYARVRIQGSLPPRLLLPKGSVSASSSLLIALRLLWSMVDLYRFLYIWSGFWTFVPLVASLELLLSFPWLKLNWCCLYCSYFS